MDADGAQSSSAFLPEMKYLPENPPPYSKIIANAEDGNRTAQIENALNEANEEDEAGAIKKRDRTNEPVPKRSTKGIIIGLLGIVIALLALLIGLLLCWLLFFNRPSTIRNLEKELFAAVENNDQLLVEQLIEKEGANPNGRLPEYQGRTPLHLAAQFGHTAMVKLLLAHGANGTIRSSGRDWQSPLHSALTDACRPEIVLMLMEKGAKPEDRDGNGKSAIDYPTNRDCHNEMYERSQEKRDWEIFTERAREGKKIMEEMENEMNNEKDVLKRLELIPKYTERLFAPFRLKNETQNLQKKGNHQ